MPPTGEPRLSQQLPIWALSLISTLPLVAIAAGQVEASTSAAMLALAPHVFARVIAGFLPEWFDAGGRPFRFAGGLAQLLSALALAGVHYEWLAPAWLIPSVAALAVSIVLQVIGCAVDFRGGRAWQRNGALAPSAATGEHQG
ncbi:hypothetical protein [Aquimonas voraii]|uniref:Uncharacterized protein n=1 Tax=Aquimonas voraii TaxID=265719 RepID=A0A1G6XCQ1_9GAMM|nr:hypothetical protein [Aquimonas voraii]SDD75075.1 hypothetical protein SAMN04488509_106125 [Aquimonas voraii]